MGPHHHVEAINVDLCVAPRRDHLLWVQVAPSQPSLQTQVNDSPATTQVPPFSHGFGRQLEFLAETGRGGEKEEEG